MAIESLTPNTKDKTLEEPLLDTTNGYVETEFDDGSIEFDFSEDSVNRQQEPVPNMNAPHFSNLIEDGPLEDSDDLLNEIAQDVLQRYEDDKGSREGWLETVNSGMSLLGIEVEETDEPFPGACSAHHPMILEAAVKFQAKASGELFSAKGPVKTAMIGAPTPEKEEQAQRIRKHMNYQVMEEMDEYFDEMERMLFYLPIVGSGFKKTYYNSILDRPVSEFIPVDEFIVNYYATSLKTASCFTHVIQRSANDLRKDIVVGLYSDDVLDFEVSPTSPQIGETTETLDAIMGTNPVADDEVYTIVEQYCFLDLEDDPDRDEDELALPYVVTVELESEKVLSIRRNWSKGDYLKKTICPFTHYKFVPGMGFYGLGFIHLLGNLQMTLTATMRSLIDSGTFANLQGGFVDKRLRVRSGDGPLGPGEYREVESGGLPLKDAILPLQFKEPSNTLLMMFQHVEARGQKFADSTEQVVSDAANYGPVGTTMALLEASGKFFSGVHKRLHKSQKHEFKILASLNYEYLGESETFDTIGNTFEISKDDYDGRIDVVPVSDPNLGSQAQKLTLAQSIYTAALQKPDIHNVYEVSKYYYSAIGIDEDYIDKFLPIPEEPQESDPLSDIQMAQQGKPIKAFEGQDHDSHITLKNAFLQDPASGGSQEMIPIVPIIQSNIQEHVVLKFKESIMGTAGDPQVLANEALTAQAAQQVAQTNSKMAELEAKGPDEARNKLADAELHRVMNESRKLEAEISDKDYQRFHDAMKIEMDKYKADLQFMTSELREENSANQARMKEMTDLLKESMKVKQASDNAAKGGTTVDGPTKA